MPSYRLVRRPTAADPPRLDPDQQRVVDHPGGPLLVLAGPGTGKTTAIVEAVVDRVERRGVDPDHVLVLTFSRRAAHELRARIAGRLRRTTREPLALTFHSYAYALVRREHLREGDHPPRVLSGPEHLLEVRRLLAGEVADGATAWPARLRAALSTRGFAEELRDLLLRAAERGLDGATLAELGRRHGREAWVAAGEFLDRYAARFDVDPVPTYDYAELMRAALALLRRPDVGERERATRRVVFVDEYQDTDPAQERLLHALAGDGRDLVAVGDPDQSIYGFRGADVRGILDFPDRFRTVEGRPAPVVALRHSRRAGPRLLASSRRLAWRLPAVPGAAQHRELIPVGPTTPDEVQVVLADGPSQEAAVVADVLRRAHLLDGVPWSQMAVLVRSVIHQAPPLRRALAAARVPVTVAGDEAPLATEPAVRPLLLALRCALRPDSLDDATAVELLTGPLGGLDALRLRRLRRALRADAPHAARPGRPPIAVRHPAGRLAAALRDPAELTLVPAKLREGPLRLATLLQATRRRARDGARVDELLWEIWRGAGLAERWSAASLAGGASAAAADRDLDAVVTLFETAARFTERTPHAGPQVFLDEVVGQEIPADTLAEHAPAGEAVRLATAHRAKGLEWDVVVVAGVQEGVWPDLRLRGNLLGVEELVDVVAGVEPAPASIAAKLLEEERRLFYVAVTRARRRLVVTAVGGDDAPQRPSRFLDELLPEGAEPQRAAASSRRLAVPDLVADLRAAVTDPTAPTRVRRAAAAHLARLAAAGARGAHPREWYALTPLSDPLPVVTAEETVRVSPSQIEQFTACGLRWLLEAAVGARAPDAVRGLGSLVHAVAALTARGELAEPAIDARLDEVFAGLDFGGPWYTRRQRALAGDMVRRYLAWQRANPRRLLAVEEPFEVRVGRVHIVGRVDRLEVDEAGRGVVVDLKTGGSRPTDAELERHPQLGVYQLAVLLSAFARHGVIEPGGAELVQLGRAGYAARARVQPQRPVGDDTDPDWPRALVDTVAEAMAGPVFAARPHEGCRTCAVRACCPAHEDGAQVTP